MAQEKVYLELPPFTGRNVPIIEIAKAINYYCPDRKVWEETGYLQPEAD